MKWILLGLGTVLLVAGAVELLRRLIFWLRRDRYGEGEMELVVIPAGWCAWRSRAVRQRPLPGGCRQSTPGWSCGPEQL